MLFCNVYILTYKLPEYINVKRYFVQLLFVLKPYRNGSCKSKWYYPHFFTKSEIYQFYNNCRFFATYFPKSEVSLVNERTSGDIENVVYRNDKEKQETLLRNEIRKNAMYNIDDINKLKSLIIPIGSFVKEINFDSIFLNYCAVEGSFEAGKSYFHTIYNTNLANIATIGKFFRLCYSSQVKCTEEDKIFIYEVYKQLRKRYSVLDGITCENAALALSITDKWKECFNLLEMCSQTVIPSSKMYSAIVIAAFRNGEIDSGWNHLNEMAKRLHVPQFEVYECWLKVSNYTEDSFTKLFLFFEEYGLQMPEDKTLKIFELVQHIAQKSNITFIKKSGICAHCKTAFKPINLSDEEFLKIRTVFLDPVLIGKDVFVKTKPAELKSYLKFLDSMGKVDVVLDGLNIAYSGPKNKNLKQMSFLLLRVVEHFINQNKKVVVFGRQHLAQLNAFQYIKKNAHYFLTDDVSYDDPFLLYATLYSGLGTYFLSRDQMRGHKFLLKDSELRRIFSKWQQKYQYYLQYVNDESVGITEPLPYQLKAQQSQHGIWHIPITTNTTNIPGHLKSSKFKWICVH